MSEKYLHVGASANRARFTFIDFNYYTRLAVARGLIQISYRQIGTENAPQR